MWPTSRARPCGPPAAELEVLLDRPLDAVTDGVEIRHPSHLLEDMNRLAALSDFFKLVPSGGSDWHGSAEGPRMIGAMMIPYSWLEKQDALVASRMQPAGHP